MDAIGYNPGMPFETDNVYAQRIGKAYGEYHSTFRSENQQVEAQLFSRGDWLVAYVSFADGLGVSDVTDAWASELQKYAAQHGFSNKLKIVRT